MRRLYYESESWKDRVITTVQDRKESKLTILLMAVARWRVDDINPEGKILRYQFSNLFRSSGDACVAATRKNMR